MIPEIDTLDKYKNYLHGGMLIILFITIISVVFNIYFEIFSWQLFLFRLVGVLDMFIVYVIGVKAIDIARQYLLK